MQDKLTVCALDECGVEFKPERDWHIYHSEKCRRRAEYLRLHPETPTDRVIAYLRSRRCTSWRCKHPEKDGRRTAFWWLPEDRADENMSTAMLLCGLCWREWNRRKASERAFLARLDQEIDDLDLDDVDFTGEIEDEPVDSYLLPAPPREPKHVPPRHALPLAFDVHEAAEEIAIRRLLGEDSSELEAALVSRSVV